VRQPLIYVATTAGKTRARSSSRLTTSGAPCATTPPGSWPHVSTSSPAPAVGVSNRSGVDKRPGDRAVAGLMARDRYRRSVEHLGVDTDRSVRSRIFDVLPAWLGAGAVIEYLLFAFMAYANYPAVFGPQNNNWLSDLGNRELNPNGAELYVWGCVIAGIVQLAFFASLSTWWSTGSKIQNWLLAVVQVAGGIAAVSLVMSAVYTEDQFAQHQFWSRLIYAGFAFALFIAPFAFRRRGRRSAALTAVAAGGYCSILASLIFAGAHWLEWTSLGLIFAFVCLIGWMSASRSPAKPPEPEQRGRLEPSA
jgi:hypothetical protein